MKTKRICKSTVSLILALIMLVSMCTVGIVSSTAAEIDTTTTNATPSTIYFVPGSYWNVDGAVFRAWVWGSSTESDKWIYFSDSDGDGTYEAGLSSGYTDIIFLRSNPSNTSGWDGEWGRYKTTIPTDGKNCLTMKSYEEGEWGTYSAPSGETKTVYVGVITYVSATLTLHYWNNSTGLAGDASLVSTGETASFSVGTGYWNDPNQTFNIYKATVPVEATGAKTYISSSNDNWAAEEITLADDIIILAFEYGGTYHNITAEYSSGGGSTGSEFVKTDWTQIAFRDDSSDSVDNDYDTNVFVSFDGGSTKTAMTKTVDTMSGHDMWVADLPTTTPTTVYFYGCRATDENCSSVLYTWNAGAYSGCTTGLYRATSTSAGKWGTSSEPYDIPDKDDINNLSFGIWVDSKGNGNAYDAVIARKDSSGNFNLYLPSNTPDSPVLYTSFAYLSINGTEITDGNTFSLENGGAYTIKYRQTVYDSESESDRKEATLYVYKTTNVATLLFQTNRDLFTETTASLVSNYQSAYKDLETKGSYYLYDEKGTQVNSDTVLKKIKGRGNSTFKASMQIYGKYAYNFNLDKKEELIDGATSSKKWCLLANNVDHTMMRNTFIYALADDIGIKYAPETRLVDVYDNGNYLGAYVITEKVEYGSNTLMNDMENLDNYHEDTFGKGYDDYLTSKSTTYSGVSYKYWTTNDTTNLPTYDYADGDESFKDYNFLLEFELEERYTDEPSWFVSKKGQPIVVKYPEYATQKEMQWIIDLWNGVEDAVYSNTTDLSTISDLIDVDSFAKMYLIQELSLNLDAASTSFYIHNDGDMLVASPVWDYDWSMGSYYKAKPITSGISATLDDPEQWFVKYKDMDTTVGGSGSNNPNFQAQLAQNSKFWERCQYIWTNTMQDAIDYYVDTDATGDNDGGVIVDEWLEKFSSALNMNFARWYGYGESGTSESWGTKQTNTYSYGTYNFCIGSDTISSGTTATASWDNTIYYLNDWLAKRMDFMANDDTSPLYNSDLLASYEITDVDFTAVQSEDGTGDTVTITPTATVTNNGETLSTSEYAYDIYINDGVYADGLIFSENETYDIILNEGVKSVIYIEVYIIADPSVTATSDSQEFEYGYIAPEITFTVMFKSSSSYRYIPTVSVAGKEYEMEKTGSYISTNTSQTQKYYWYSAEVTAEEGANVTILFTNQYSMRAGTTMTPEADATYYFGCDNLNSGSTLVDLTDAEEYAKNFVKSATHMVYNDVYDSGVATTSIDGTIYKMGDADGDDSVTILDATTIQYALVEKTELSDVGSDLSDFDLDGTTSIMDATLVQTYLVQ